MYTYLELPYFEFTNGYKIVHKVWSSIEEEPYCFSRSSVKFQGHTGQKFADFDPNWAFPDCISSLNSPMALKWSTKLRVVEKRCPIVFRGHPSNFEVIRVEKWTIWIQFEQDYQAGRSYQIPQICLVCHFLTLRSRWLSKSSLVDDMDQIIIWSLFHLLNTSMILY